MGTFIGSFSPINFRDLLNVLDMDEGLNKSMESVSLSNQLADTSVRVFGLKRQIGYLYTKNKRTRSESTKHAVLCTVRAMLHQKRLRKMALLEQGLAGRSQTINTPLLSVLCHNCHLVAEAPL